MTVGTQDWWLPLAKSYDLSLPDYSQGKCSKVFLEHLHYFHTWSCLLPPKYKAIICRISKNLRCNSPQTTSRILFGVQCTHHCGWNQHRSCIHHMYWFYSAIWWMVEGSIFHHRIPCVCWWLQINLQKPQWWEKECLMLCC